MRVEGGRLWTVLHARVVVPEDQLWQDDDGPSQITLPREPTWWLRYFDYL